MLQRNHPRSRPGTLLLIAASLLLASAASSQVSRSSLLSFDPVPESISVQHSEAAPHLGNTLVAMQLDHKELERLDAETGRTDFMLLGSQGNRTVLRDDGVFPDDRKGDRRFVGFAQVDLPQLEQRGVADAVLTSRSQTQLVLKGREITGSIASEPFALAKFLDGEAVTLGPPISTLTSPTPGFTTAFQDEVLMITDSSVVGDPIRTIDPCSPPPAGSPLPAWSFGRLMTDMANPGLTGIDPRVFVEDWLEHWLVNQTVNSFTVSARPAMQDLLDDWHAASAGPQLDLRLAPMRLIAIVPRLDLRRTTTGGGGYGGASGTNFLDAGEGRFVFAVVDSFNGCQETPWTVILEYEVPLRKCVDVRQWARDWIALDSLTIGSAAYLSHLHSLTDVFAAAGAAPPKPNRSAINQVRTNENELDPLWELREFRLLDPTPSLLSESTVAETPDDGFRPSALINSFIAAGSPSPMPLLHPTALVPFRGGASENPFPPSGTFWDGVPSMPGPASGRHTLSLNTCNGCHGGETDTFFVHINPAPNGALSTVPLLSDFLIGGNVTDPVDGTVRFFDDLDRREIDMQDVAGTVCFSVVPVPAGLLEEHLATAGTLPENPFGKNALSTVKANDLSLDLLPRPRIKSVH